jgi:predicted RNA binding protein with dsRBD fold (UPF0201 family)
MPDIRMTVRCFPTEERTTVVEAITKLFPDAVVEGDDPMTARASSVDVFAEKLARQRIRSAARKTLRRGMSGEETHFKLSKQVATLGKVSFAVGEQPLGDIEVVIKADDMARLIDVIAPKPSSEEGGS